MQLFKRFKSLPVSRSVFLPLRVFLGVTFLYAGFQKLTDPQFFDPHAIGYIGNQLHSYAQVSPLKNLLKSIEPQALLIGLIIAYGEIAIGLGTLFGFLARPAAFFGLLLSLALFLSATWNIYPYFYGSDIVFIVCWLTLLLNGVANTGLPTLDEYFAQYFMQRARTTKQRQRLTLLLRTLLGISLPTTAKPVNNGVPVITSQQPAFTRPLNNQFGDWQTGKSPLIRPPFGGPNTTGRLSQPLPAMPQFPRITSQLPTPQAVLAPSGPPLSQEQRRRSFLKGILTGVASTLATAGLGYALVILTSKKDKPLTTTTKPTGSPTPKATPGKKTPTPAPTSGPTKPSIAQAPAVRLNSAVTFNIPETESTGILVHLGSDQFVAFDATCTHAGCLVDYDPQSALLVCPCHGAEYDPARQAAVVHAPARFPLKSLAIHINSDTGDVTLA